MVRLKRSAFARDRREEAKEERREAREERKAARREAKDERKDARRDAREEKKAARETKRERIREVRESDLKGKAKRDAKRDARSDKRDEVKLAKQEKRDRQQAARDEKKATLKAVREEKRSALKALRIPRAANRRWVSYLRFQNVKAMEVFKPKTLAQLQTICRIATDNGLAVRAVGSGHSFSEVGVTEDILLETKQMNRMFKLGKQKRARRFKSEHRKRPMAEFEVGRTIIDLSKSLEASDHALANQGTYDGQTFWGAVSTSTHGSGINRGPLPNMVLSVVLVGEGGRTFRVEPRDGITDPSGWNEAGIDELIQDDDVFYSVICSFGSMGVVYSAVIELSDFYWLNEWTYITTWEIFKSSFRRVDELVALLEQWDTFSLLVAPSKGKHGKKDGVSFKGEHPCSLTFRKKTEQRRKIGGRAMDALTKALEHIGVVSGKAPAEGAEDVWQVTDVKRDDGWIARLAVKQSGKHGWTGEELDPEKLPVKRRNKCYKIFPKGGKLFGGYALEVAFPIERTIEIMDKLLERSAENEAQGLYHSAPIAVRFVDSSLAYASPQYGRRTVMFEILMAKGSEGGKEALANIERAMLEEPDVRVHWGLHVDQMNADNMDFARAYPRWAAFRRTFERFNAQGTFANRFTRRIGLS